MDEALLNFHNMLSLDSFHEYVTEEVKISIISRDMDQVVIPGGLTLMLPRLEVCINWLFKAMLKVQYGICNGGTYIHTTLHHSQFCV
jgi:hypothetical protein